LDTEKPDFSALAYHLPHINRGGMKFGWTVLVQTMVADETVLGHLT
jgi:hypothetical protein